MIRKVIIALILLMIFLPGAFSQYYSGGLSSSFNLPRTQYVVDSTGKVLFKPGDMGFSMQIGTSFTGNFKGNSSFGTFVSPAIAYNVSSRFRIKTGVTVFQNFGDPYYSAYDGYYSPVINPGTTTSLFIQGDYLINNKLMLSGAYYKDFSAFNANISDPRYKNPGSEGVILNLNYRPTSSFEINASFGYGKGTRSILHDPFYNNGFFPGGAMW